MTFCIKCGQQLNKNDVFCPNCGTKLEKVQNNQKDKKTKTTKKKNKEDRKKIYIIAGIVVALVIVAVGIAIYFALQNTAAKEYKDKIAEAQKYVEVLDYEKAEDAYLEAIEIDPKESQSYIELADVYMAQGKKDESVEILEKGIKNVNDSNKKEIESKLEEIKNISLVINNGGQHVIYQNYTYYWQYESDSFVHEALFANYYYQKCDNNSLIQEDSKGNKKVIYKGNGYGNIWIANNRLFLKRKVEEGPGDEEIFSIKFDGSNEENHGNIIIFDIDNDNEDFIVMESIEQRSIYLFDTKKLEMNLIKSNAFFDYYEDDIVYFEEVIMDSIDNDKIIFKNIDINGENEITLATINSTDIYDYKPDFSIYINCVQILDDYVYFSYGGIDGTAYVYQGGQIARVKKDGSDFEVLEGEPQDFTVYVKDGKINIKEDGKLLEPFIDEDGNAWVYTKDSDEKIELISNGEDYQKVINETSLTNIKDVDYIGDYVYFTVDNSIYDSSLSMGWRDGYRWKTSSYYRKNLKTNKLEKIYELSA